MFLVLGGSGFIGIHLINRLRALDDVRVFGKNTGYVKEMFPEVDVVDGDFKTCDFAQLLQGIDVVYHLISTAIPHNGTDQIAYDIEETVVPTITLLDNMVKLRIKKIIFCSSGGTIYGNYDGKITEDSVLNPICTYGVQKLAIEHYLRLYEFYHKIKAYSVRIMNPYGLKFRDNVKQGIIPIFIKNILSGKPIEIWGDGETLRDYIYIDDVVSALIKVNCYQGHFRTFNIGTGNSYSLNQVTELLFNITGKKVDIIYKEKRLCDVQNSSVSIERALSELEWRPKYSITDGVKLLLIKMDIDIQKEEGKT